ncbi:MAG: hypothetical protein B6U85_01120 [Desulfurococcales archaeon ex4484_42]|nr:MAG: hypothetical protein B6U85_01120 [Desulfurococcales archaeon ex4484_42]
MVKKIILDIVVDVGEREVAIALYKALLPESKIRLRGIESRLVLNDSSIKISIEAPDYSSLRAVSNALLRLSDTVLKVIKCLR